MTLLEDVLARLEEEYRREGKSPWFEAMRPALTAERDSIACSEMAARLGIAEGAARVAAHRLRRRYRKLLRAEIANTVASPDEVDDEMRHLFQVLTNG